MDFGTSVLETINDSKLENIKVKIIGYTDSFVKQGSVEEIEKKYGLDLESIFEKIKSR